MTTPATLPDLAIDEEFRRIVDELTRRGFLTGGLAAATALGLAACSTDSSGSSPSASTGTRLVDSVHGRIRVPAEPKRIVSVNQFDTVALYDLGITPVGVYDYGIDYTSPRYRKKYAAAPKIGTTGIDIEKVAALKPDLILGYDIDFNNTAFKQLTAIAPTVITTNASWKACAQQIADAVHRSDSYDALKAKYAQRCQTIRKRYARVLDSTKWDALQGGFDTGTCWVYSTRAAFVDVMTDAGVKLATSTAKPADQVYTSLSYENLSELADADVIAYWSAYGNDKPVNNGPQLFAQQGWKDLPAVKAGRLVPIADVAMNSYGDALAVLDELETSLKKLRETT